MTAEGRCSAWVYTDSMSNPSKPCSRRAVEEVKGHGWCRQHATQARRIGVQAASLGRIKQAEEE